MNTFRKYQILENSRNTPVSDRFLITLLKYGIGIKYLIFNTFSKLFDTERQLSKMNQLTDVHDRWTPVVMK